MEINHFDEVPNNCRQNGKKKNKTHSVVLQESIDRRKIALVCMVEMGTRSGSSFRRL